jgi:hypothetical protein
VRESLLEVVISPSIHHPGRRRMNACAMIPVEKNEFGNMKIVKKTTD